LLTGASRVRIPPPVPAPLAATAGEARRPSGQTERQELLELSGLGGAAIVPRLARPAVLAATALVFGRALRRNALDDPYVTYRYAENLLAGLGPVYNPGEPVLSTTALGYGLLLAVLKLALPWAALPALSNAVSAL